MDKRDTEKEEGLNGKELMHLCIDKENRYDRRGIKGFKKYKICSPLRSLCTDVLVFLKPSLNR